MKLSRLRNIKGKPKQTDRFTSITDESDKLPIPFGPRFQAEVPPWTGPTTDVDDSKWLGTIVCLANRNSQCTKNGRSDVCRCAFPGSIECVRKHVSNKKIQLQSELGHAFWKWKFDDMGVDVSRIWSPDEENMFDRVVKANLTSDGRDFMKSALGLLPSKTKTSIVSYYLNVYIPRRISRQSRSNCTMIDTDDDDADDMPSVKGARKRFQVSNLTSSSLPDKYIKTR